MLPSAGAPSALLLLLLLLLLPPLLLLMLLFGGRNGAQSGCTISPSPFGVRGSIWTEVLPLVLPALHAA